jgi:hypothetical protein
MEGVQVEDYSGMRRHDHGLFPNSKGSGLAFGTFYNAQEWVEQSKCFKLAEVSAGAFVVFASDLP